MKNKPRCGWEGNTKLMIRYHDSEWGVPVHDDRKLFEFLTLDAFQAGLSWAGILGKRENFRAAFDNFDAIQIAKYDEQKVQQLLQDSGIIRNKSKITCTISNAQRFLKLQQEFGSFDQYIWQFTNGKTIVNQWQELSQVPASSPESDAMSKDLKARGFKFVGSIICYAFMQAAGMVNDHLLGCFRYQELAGQK
ncbi:MAG: DNA-3-methyladenine glycosylase I [Candidatus Cloacimonetes bacterium]|jgi:DNA-3-methyladenine glycosylase I|nr:DNA-3-methyladenine glycosylase I [Candidatus Cloacimonadota bacterium]MDD2424065.1 DNA-3-methyladenine glycosylase I [Candidatus Cloacimonadota bacterium]MDY0325223.1 DNA-3-methyladenine glycosylase I [Candidatus Cloacimonadaceae bacterium]